MPQQERVTSHSRASPSCWVNRHPTGRTVNSRFLEVDGLRVKYIGEPPCPNNSVDVIRDGPSFDISNVYSQVRGLRIRMRLA